MPWCARPQGGARWARDRRRGSSTAAAGPPAWWRRHHIRKTRVQPNIETHARPRLPRGIFMSASAQADEGEALRALFDGGGALHSRAAYARVPSSAADFGRADYWRQRYAVEAADGAASTVTSYYDWYGVTYAHFKAALRAAGRSLHAADVVVHLGAGTSGYGAALEADGCISVDSDIDPALLVRFLCVSLHAPKPDMQRCCRRVWRASRPRRRAGCAMSRWTRRHLRCGAAAPSTSSRREHSTRCTVRRVRLLPRARAQTTRAALTPHARPLSRSCRRRLARAARDTAGARRAEAWRRTVVHQCTAARAAGLSQRWRRRRRHSQPRPGPLPSRRARPACNRRNMTEQLDMFLVFQSALLRLMTR